jgi:hypothetical protein
MNNIKSLLREGLIINDRQNLLSEHSISLINEPNHVKYVLGINIPINEVYSLSIKRQVIEEQLIYETMLDSINKFIGSALEKGKEKAIQVVDGVKSLKDIAILIKDLILTPEWMDNAIRKIKLVTTNIISELQNNINQLFNIIKVNLQGFTDKFKGLTEKIISTATKLTNGTGWKGFLSMLGFCALIKFLINSIIGKLISGGVEFITKNIKLVDGVSDLFNSFKDFISDISSADIQPILSWFSEIGIGTAISSFTTGFSVITILGELLAPVIKSTNFTKTLVKK